MGLEDWGDGELFDASMTRWALAARAIEKELRQRRKRAAHRLHVFGYYLSYGIPRDFTFHRNP